MNYEVLKDRIFAETERLLPDLAEISDDIADHPELSGQEFETSKKLVDFLKTKGYQTEYPFAGRETAFRAVYGKNNHKYKVALLTEYDALPELGHACGHCLSAAAGIMAGLVMKDFQDEMDVDFHIVGTPDEEDDGAKCQMAEQGVFDGYDLAIMVHYYHRNLVMPKFQSLGEFFYEFHGESAHEQYALDGVRMMIHAVDMLRQHTKKDAQFHYIIKAGGLSRSMAAEKTVLQLFIRAENKKHMEELVSMVDHCAEGAAVATQTEYTKYPREQLYYVDLRRNDTCETAVREVFKELEIRENAPKDAVFGSSDIGNVSYVCPVLHPCLQIVDEAPIHTREFADAVKSDRAHQAIAEGARLIGLTAVKIFCDEIRIINMKADFKGN